MPSFVINNLLWLYLLLVIVPPFLFVIAREAYQSHINKHMFTSSILTTELEKIEHEIESRQKEVETRQKEIEKIQKERGLVKFVDMFGREKWVAPTQAKELKIIDMDMRNNFARLTPRQFERLVSNLFEKRGYDVTLTPEKSDYGADVIAKKGRDAIVIQVKKYAPSHRVSNRDVQRLLGSMWKFKANKAVFVTSSDYTDFAYRQARGAPIELWNYRKLCEMIEKHILNI